MKTSLGMAKFEMGVFLIGIVLTASVLYVSLDSGLQRLPGFDAGPSPSDDAAVESPSSTSPAEPDGSEVLTGSSGRAGFFADGRLESLNRSLPAPASDRDARMEAELLAVQLRRFETRYGADSVAARSVRLRLADLDAGREVEYAVAPAALGRCDSSIPESGVVETEAC